MAAHSASRSWAMIAMPLTDPELHTLVHAADQQARDVLARAAIHQDVRTRQLNVLRNTYPAWDIDLERDGFGQLRWIARLRWRVTVRMVTAGIMQSLRRDDAIALASTLAWQTSLLHSVRGPGHP